MSIISTVYLSEGIVMAADSRITATRRDLVNELEEISNFTMSDNGQKIVRLNKVKIGINFCGNMIYGGNTIADCLRLFEINKVEEQDTIEEVANKLFTYMNGFSGTAFTLAGYEHDEAFVYEVTDHVSRVNAPNGNVQPGVYYNGQTEAITKLLKTGETMPLNMNLMPLKDGVDFAEFLVDLTIKYERFQDRIQTCGGDIDVLVITKDEMFWHKHKLHKNK